MRLEVIPIPCQDVSSMWLVVEGMVAKALKKSRNQQSAELWRQACVRGKGHILVVLTEGKVLRGCAILERHDERLHLVTLTCPGFLKGFVPLLDVWRRLARDAGCTVVSLKGRLGWDRVLRPYGFLPLDDSTLGASADGI